MMENAKVEFCRFEKEMDRAAEAMHDSFVTMAENARKLGKNLEKAATFDSKRYIEVAVNFATASMRSAVRAILSSFNNHKDGRVLCRLPLYPRCRCRPPEASSSRFICLIAQAARDRRPLFPQILLMLTTSGSTQMDGTWTTMRMTRKSKWVAQDFVRQFDINEFFHVYT
ncbi:Unknown protein [Striga hermonthica]|uniref:Uncharacterized protein n=1 Tax=Striga hermonthica TaxID=68872 RepID=A0A9N7RRZ8_STRHE|nr:Unknown protein [Striga hermonthica]